MLKIKSVEFLIGELSKWPGVGPKTAQRYAYSILKNALQNSTAAGGGVPQASVQNVDALIQALENIKTGVRLCPSCFNFTEEVDRCYFCSSPERSKHTICVVEEPSDIERIESSGAFKGCYHVLHGVIAPLMGVTPDKIKIQELVQKVSENSVEEIIFALDLDLEGETTILYLTQALSGLPVKLSRLAQGVPMGSDMDYLDERTLGRALQNRVEIIDQPSFDKR